MKILEITAQKRTKLGGSTSRAFRRESLVPGVLYGKKGKAVVSIHFLMQAIDLESLKYEPCFIQLKIEGESFRCILQEKQVHPVSGMPIHVDFLAISDEQLITMGIPLHLIEKSIGEKKGGVLLQKIRRLKIRALASDMPDKIEVSIANLELGKTMQVKEIETTGYAILNSPLSPIAAVEIPRALRSKSNNEATDESAE